MLKLPGKNQTPTTKNQKPHFKMDNLTKEQKDEYATCFAILALYDGNVSNNILLFL